MPSETLNIRITGANPNGTGVNVSIPVDLASGNGSYSFLYAGSSSGLDTVIATIPSLGLTSNSASVSWLSTLGPASTPAFVECGGILTANANGTVSPLPGSSGEWEMRGGLGYQIRTIPGLGSELLTYLS